MSSPDSPSATPSQPGSITAPDPARVEEFWRRFREAAGPEGVPDRPVDVFAFGDSAAMADELADLVLAGTKRATAGSVVEYDAEGWRPQVGDLSVVHRGDGTPVAVIRSTEVTVGSLTSVTASFAWDEGEGDRTREDWVAGHQRYFARSSARAGLPYADDMDVVFERFDVVWAPGEDEAPRT